LQDAYLLKNLLLDEQIEAVVLNGVLEGGAGVDILGWPTAARVAVPPDEAERARQIAEQFDARLAAAAESAASETEESAAESSVPVAPEWPRCPECNAPRTTQCPACGATGSNFRPADPAAVDILSPNAAAEAASGVSCGPCGCSSAENASCGPGVASGAAEPDLPAPALVCPTCDEPFVPQYARRCEACGHEFPDGMDVEPRDTPLDSINTHILAAMVGIVALIVAIGVWFVFMF
jgi:hypothetical protein